MLKKFITFCLITGSLILALPKHVESYVAPKVVIKPTVSELITKYSAEYQISEEVLSRVSYCESRHRPDAINYNDGGKGKHSVGVMQYQEATFLHWEKILGEDLDYYSYNDQLKLASFMFSKKQHRQWTCYNMIYGKRV